MLLKLNNLIFGENEFRFLVLLQLMLGFYAALSCAATFKKLYNLSKGLEWVVGLVLLFPYFVNRFGNTLLTEALCYPLFLLAFSALLQGLLLKQMRFFAKLMVLMGLLILTRNQFLFLYPLMVLVLISCWNKE